MATMQQQIAAEYNVTLEQIDRCQRWIDGATNTVFYTIESASNPGTYYKVLYNREHQCLQCLPHNGEQCPASLRGLPCYHKRAAVATERIYKYEVAQERRREAEALEATAAYQSEQVALRVAQAEALVNGAHEAAKREASATKRNGTRAYERQAFSLLR